MKALISVICAAFLIGCATKTPEPVRASKAAGMLESEYSYGIFQRPEVQWEEGLSLAREHCRAWGYSDATRMKHRKREGCPNQPVWEDCYRITVTVPYQCTE